MVINNLLIRNRTLAFKFSLSIDKKDLIRVLTELNFPFSKPEVDQWIWEVDEDLDGEIN